MSAGPHATVIEVRDGYVIVKKLGVAADIVTAIGERSEAEEPSG